MKEIMRTDKQYFICPFCGKDFRALAYHTRQVHDISAKNLRKMFGLKHNYQLITPDLKEVHRKIAIDNNEGEKLKKVGQNTRFRKGFEGHTRDNWSEQAIKELGARTRKMMIEKTR
jgi:predicted transcriptional regulator